MTKEHKYLLSESVQISPMYIYIYVGFMIALKRTTGILSKINEKSLIQGYILFIIDCYINSKCIQI